MRPHLKSVGWAAVTLLVSVTPTLLPVTPTLLPAIAQTMQDHKAEADRLGNEAVRQYQTSQFQAALATFQKELIIRREIGDRSIAWVSSSLGVIATVTTHLLQMDHPHFTQSIALLPSRPILN
jgi:hypothetical protein